MNDAASRLIDDEEDVVFVEDGERPFFRLRPAAHVIRGTLDLVHPIEHPTVMSIFSSPMKLRLPPPDQTLPGRSEAMPSVFYAVGHYRNGVLLAPLTAALMADLVLEDRERAELALVRPGRLANA